MNVLNKEIDNQLDIMNVAIKENNKRKIKQCRENLKLLIEEKKEIEKNFK